MASFHFASIWVFLFFTFSFGASAEIKYEKLERDYKLLSSENPCNDFHQYVCGEEEKKFKLPPDRSFYEFSFHDAAEALLSYKKSYFKNLSKLEPQSEREGMLRNLYVSCMDESASKLDEIKTKNDLITKINSFKTKDEALNFLGANLVSSFSGFVKPDVINNQEDSSFLDLIIFTNTISLPERSYYANEALKKDFLDYISDFFKTLDVDAYSKNAESNAQFVFEFENKLIQVFPLPLEIRQQLGEKHFIKKSQLLALKNLRLSGFLNQIPKKVAIRELGFKSLVVLNDELEKMSLYQIKTLLVFYNIKDILDDSAPAFSTKFTNFSAKHLGGQPVRPSREERCTTLVMKSFPMELDSVILPRIFPNFSEEKVVHLVEKIRSGIISTLAENKWLSKKGKEGAIKKIKTAKLFLVSPKTEEQWNFKPLLKLNPKTPVQNVLSYKQVVLHKTVSELGIKIPKDRWVNGPLDVNAYYDPTQNMFVLLMGILQKPFYDPNASDAQNMAAMGMIIGHELGHGIDDNGRRFDYLGRVRDWVSMKDIAGLRERSFPLVKQFEDLGHNGQLTLGENIGDLVGLTTAFKVSFPDYQAGKYTQDKLQQFFIQYGRLWCEVQTDSFKEMRLKTNPHSLGYARINAQVSNQPGFMEAFSCKPGQKMFKDKKDLVEIW